ncbi:MAG: SRPBCC family protein [Pseudonocardia sp.]|nr:SRPBCC family protein [Pseudonocardia sp.]
MVRYSDTPAVEVSTLVAAPPERLWPLVTDIELIASLSTELRRVRWLDKGERPEVGRRFEGTNLHPAHGEWTSTSQVIECTEPQLFSWAVGAVDDPAATWGFELTPTEGGTRLRQFARIGPGWSGLNEVIARMPDMEERIVESRLGEFRAGMERNLAVLRELAETGQLSKPG